MIGFKPDIDGCVRIVELPQLIHSAENFSFLIVVVIESLIGSRTFQVPTTVDKCLEINVDLAKVDCDVLLQLKHPVEAVLLRIVA